MFDFLKKLFEEEEKEFSTEWDESAELLRELKQEEIDEAESEAEELTDESEKLIEELEKSLEEVKGYEDRQGIEAVEDVADNFYSSRKRLIENLELSKRPQTHLEDLKSFIEEFEDVSRKEEAVMKRVKNEANSLFGAIKDIHEHIEKFENFIKGDYATVTSVEEVESRIDKIENIEDKMAELQEEKSDIDIQKIEEEISGLEDQIERLEKSEEWRQKEEIEETLEDLRKERDDIESELKKQLSKIERPLKKLVYNIESGEVEYEGSDEALKRMRDQKIDELDSVDLSEAYSLAEENEFIDESQVKKLNEVSGALEDFSERKNKIGEIEAEIKDLENKLEGLDVADEKRVLLNNLSSKREELRNRKIDQDELLEEIEGLEEKKSKLLSDLEEKMDDLTHHQIEVRKE